MEERKEVIIELLKEKDMYGFEMIRKLEERSNYLFDKNVGTLYPVLRSLEEQRYLKSYEIKVGNKVRKCYQLIKKQGGG